MSWNGSEQLERAMEEVLDDVGDGPKAAEEKESPIALGSQNRPPSLTLDTAPNGTSCSQYTYMHTHTQINELSNSLLPVAKCYNWGAVNTLPLYLSHTSSFIHS